MKIDLFSPFYRPINASAFDRAIGEYWKIKEQADKILILVDNNQDMSDLDYENNMNEYDYLMSEVMTYLQRAYDSQIKSARLTDWEQNFFQSFHSSGRISRKQADIIRRKCGEYEEQGRVTYMVRVLGKIYILNQNYLTIRESKF